MAIKHDRIVNMLVAQRGHIDRTLSRDGHEAESKKLIGMMQMLNEIVSYQEYKQIILDVQKKVRM